jgi:Rad3-related DNA helicase
VRSIALVLHKSLQTANYEEQYDFEVLFGKGNYPCEDKTDKPKMQPSFLPSQLLTAYDCGETGCECPYQLQYECCMRSNRVSLNYAKFLMSKPFTRDYEPQYLFLDEAHNLPSIVTDFVGCTIDWDNEFLQCNGGIKPREQGRLALNEAMNLFRQCARAVDANEVKQRDDLVRWRKWHRLWLKIRMTNDILTTSDLRDWYFEANDDQLIIKPLTAKYHFKRLFGMAYKVVLMSATIKPSIAERLGLEDDEWDYHEAPNVWPVPSRLIYDLGGPAINYKSSDEDKQEQASLIASILQTDKTGTIHVMSKSQAKQLKYRLGNIVAGIKFHLPTIGIGTDNQLQEWYDVRQPGIYCISWCFHEGVDLGGDDIGVLGKVPYTSLLKTMTLNGTENRRLTRLSKF